ncbi:unnamed protein product [Cyprideis torosa]|uniref:Uncharacterized protein n=1 Tax=Cyprideis torosa TaxID=163714 RepID=A0A7R8ZL71_9CRUS|nr:unnamed protein product [Cyprideis torosa]CAG0882974.1 unnamed protein product [Cyprideis torosa]
MNLEEQDTAPHVVVSELQVVDIRHTSVLQGHRDECRRQLSVTRIPSVQLRRAFSNSDPNPSGPPLTIDEPAVVERKPVPARALAGKSLDTPESIDSVTSEEPLDFQTFDSRESLETFNSGEPVEIFNSGEPVETSNNGVETYGEPVNMEDTFNNGEPVNMQTFNSGEPVNMETSHQGSVYLQNSQSHSLRNAEAGNNLESSEATHSGTFEAPNLESLLEESVNLDAWEPSTLETIAEESVAEEWKLSPPHSPER